MPRARTLRKIRKTRLQQKIYLSTILKSKNDRQKLTFKLKNT